MGYIAGLMFLATFIYTWNDIEKNEDGVKNPLFSFSDKVGVSFLTSVFWTSIGTALVYVLTLVFN